jgi:hypothetical protein
MHDLCPMVLLFVAALLAPSSQLFHAAETEVCFCGLLRGCSSFNEDGWPHRNKLTIQRVFIINFCWPDRWSAPEFGTFYY